jgi:hypothetical protein
MAAQSLCDALTFAPTVAPIIQNYQGKKHFLPLDLPSRILKRALVSRAVRDRLRYGFAEALKTSRADSLCSFVSFVVQLELAFHPTLL